MYLAANGVGVYAGASTATQWTAQPVGTAFQAQIVNASWALIVSGPWAGHYLLTDDITTSNPAAPLADSPAGSMRAPVGAQVTRWVSGFAGTAIPVTVRQSASTHSDEVGELVHGTAVTGTYVSEDWFRISSGAYAGYYVSAAVLANTSNFSSIDGRMASGDLCALPNAYQTSWEPTTARYLDCAAAASLEEMDATFRAQFGYDLVVNEGYRSLAKQNLFFAMWGSPRAAYPGTSNHGLGAAVDFGTPLNRASNPFVFGSDADTWLTAHGKEYGWDRPSFLDAGSPSAEYWHYNYVG